MVRDPAFFGINFKKNKRDKKPMPYVDVSDEDDNKSLPKELKRKSPLVNGHDNPVQGSSNDNKHKKRRYSIPDGDSFQPNGLKDAGSSHPVSVNGSDVSAKVRLIQKQRKDLPISTGRFSNFKCCRLFILDPGRETLVEEIRKNDVTILLGETGSGKTTRKSIHKSIFLALLSLTEVPQYILESGLARNGIIAVTQPRRVAATSLALRVAAEQSTSVGKLVGYAVRFDEKHSPNTRIKYLTDGMIVRELMSDPTLSKYSVIIVDEAHERTMRTDLLIANLKSIQKDRNPLPDSKGKQRADGSNPLKIVIMSATLDAEKFSRFFKEYVSISFSPQYLTILSAKILYIKGRQHPVKIYHSAESQLDYTDAAMRTFFQIHIDQPPGDVLIFLPGQEDIESLQKSILTFAKRLPVDKLAVRCQFFLFVFCVMK